MHPCNTEHRNTISHKPYTTRHHQNCKEKNLKMPIFAKATVIDIKIKMFKVNFFSPSNLSIGK